MAARWRALIAVAVCAVALAGLVCSGCELGAGDDNGASGGTNGNGDGSNNGGGDLIAAGTIQGRLVDAENPDQGIADAFIYVPPIGGRALARTAGATSVHTDSQGRFEVAATAARVGRLVVEPPQGSDYDVGEIPVGMPADKGLALEVRHPRKGLIQLIATIGIEPAEVALQPGGSQAFVATIADADGNALPVQPTWLVLGDIGTVDADGVLTAGDTAASGTVIATLGGASASASVTVGDAPENEPPVIESLEAGADVLGPGQTTTIAVVATDPDDDELTYSWLCTGSVADGSGSTVAWRAPTQPGAYKTTVIVTDGRGGQASRELSIEVREGQTDTNWVEWEGHEYRLWDQALTWRAAHDKAHTFVNGELLVMDSADEELFIRTQFGQDPLWIGFTNSEGFGASEGNWAWVTGAPVAYTNWDAGRPVDSDAEELFGLMNYDGRNVWADMGDAATAQAVFEREISEEGHGSG